MKRILLFVSAVVLIASCGKKVDKKEELVQLKKEQAELTEKIKKLEREVGPETSNDPSKKEEAKSVAIQTLKKAPFDHYIEVQGRVDADDNVAVSAEMGGIITKVLVNVGANVSKGQVLAEMDNKVVMQGIAELQSSLDFARSMFQKQEKLWQQKIGTEIQYLTAKNQKESLENKMATMKEQLSMTRIKSPINGTVDAVDVKVGQAMMPGIPAFRVVNFNNLKIKAEIAESYASKVKTGSKVKVNFPDLDDSLVTKIDYAAKVINALNRTYNVEVNLKGDKDYHPNMVAVLRINDYSSPSPVITVPINTIQNSEEGEFVYIVENKKVKKAKIVTSKIYNGYAEVVSGLEEGDTLITKGQQDINEGESIAVNAK